jgi:peptide deformylase
MTTRTVTVADGKTTISGGLQIIPDNDPRIHIRVPDEEFADSLADREKLVFDLFEKMYQHRAIGLAANQVGIMRRVFVMDVAGRKLACFNPVITPITSDTVLLSEGCLSFPDIHLKIKRPSAIQLQYQNANGSADEVVLQEWPARCALHETDHLNGVVFTDLVSKLRLQMALKKAKRS